MAHGRCDWWTEARFGMFIHWGVYAIPARGEWVMTRERIPVPDYERRYASRFDPVSFDPAAWAELAVAAGQRYAVITTKHHDGFCLFDSKQTDYTAMHVPAGRDLLAEWLAAFRAAGLRVGFYHSLLDWHHPEYTIDRHHPLRDDGAAKAKPRDQARYCDYLHAQVEELLGNYGTIDVMWFDFTFEDKGPAEWRSEELLAMVRRLQPEIIINNRTGLPGDFTTPEQRIPPDGLRDDSGQPLFWESCITINGNWGYARDDAAHKSPKRLVHMLVECVSKGGNLLLNVGPTALGTIQPEHEQRLRRVGEWMKVNGESIYGCGLPGHPQPDGALLTAKPGVLYVHVFSPGEGRVTLPGLGGRAVWARMLCDGSEVPLVRSGDDAVLAVPAVLPDPLDTVIAVELG